MNSANTEWIKFTQRSPLHNEMPVWAWRAGITPDYVTFSDGDWSDTNYTHWQKTELPAVPAPPRPKTLEDADREAYLNWLGPYREPQPEQAFLAARANLREELLQSLRDESMYMQTGAYNRLTALLKGEQ